MVTLTALENLQGLLSLIFVLISIMLGLFIIAKFLKFKDINLLLVGLTWIFFISVYWCDAINYVMILTTGAQLSREAYFFLGAGGLVIIAAFSWILAMTDMIEGWKDKQKIIVGITMIICIIFEILLITFLITDPSLIGTQIAPFYAEWTVLFQIYLVFGLVLFLITGILFVKRSLVSDNAEIKLKGRFLAIAFLTFSIGAVIDVIGGLTEVTLVIARTFVIISSFTFYIGFTLPKFIKELFLKE